jgi:SecD/SecF fusion protein
VLPSKSVRVDITNPQYTAGDDHAYKEWTVRLSVPPADGSEILDALNAKLASTPVYLSDSTIGSRVASSTQGTALLALGASIVMIVVYIWIRFQNVIYGIGAVVALIHDVLVTVAGVALSAYVAGFLGFLLVDPFKISLNVVAAMLTIVGYSISDTIVIFDRIREVRGKSPDLTEEMVNKSVNQTLSRTVLTVFTVLLVTVILYIAGGQAIHAFAFTMLIGLISGTYSSVYIAAPCLLWLKLPSEKNAR